MVKILLSLFALLLVPSSLLAQASVVKLSIENTELFVGDAIIVDIESSGLVEPLNVEPIKKIAQFDRETYGTRIAVIKGKVVENNIRRMEFTATAPGTLIFGPITGVTIAGNISSNSIGVTIQEADNQHWSPSADVLDIAFNIDNASPYIHEQLKATLTLRHRFAIADETISLPDLSRFDVVPIMEQRRTLDSTNEGWRVITWQWLLHPKESGQFTLDGPTWSGLMVKSRTQRGNFDIAGQTIHFHIKPSINAEEWWLPASNISLEESWSDPVTELSAGDEVIRTVTVIADGALSQQIPDIKPLPSRAISSVLINKQRDQELIGGKLQSKAVFQFRMTAQSPIPVFLDTIRVPWWDTRNNKMSEAIIPARRINVGLPERSDVLASLALKGSFWERSVLKFNSMDGGWWLPALLIALLAALVALGIRTKYMANLFRQMLTRRQIRAINRAVANKKWHSAWTELSKLPKGACNANDAYELKTHCESQLFRQHNDPTATVTATPTRLRYTKAAVNPTTAPPPLAI